MRIMGLDVGTKTIGVAISDELLITAQPITVINRVNFNEDFKKLYELIEEYDVKKIVVGLPKNMNNSEGFMVDYINSFIKKIKKKILYSESIKRDISVDVLDERLTSIMADKAMLEADLSRKKRDEKIDKIAASIILKDYLDKLRYENERINRDD